MFLFGPFCSLGATYKHMHSASVSLSDVRHSARPLLTRLQLRGQGDLCHTFPGRGSLYAGTAVGLDGDHALLSTRAGLGIFPVVLCLAVGAGEGDPQVLTLVFLHTRPRTSPPPFLCPKTSPPGPSHQLSWFPNISLFACKNPIFLRITSQPNTKNQVWGGGGGRGAPTW